MRKIAVIGAGTMGNGIAHTFAQSGYEVSLIDVSVDSLERGMNTIEKNLDRMLKREKISKDDKQTTLDKITTYTSRMMVYQVLILLLRLQQKIWMSN